MGASSSAKPAWAAKSCASCSSALAASVLTMGGRLSSTSMSSSMSGPTEHRLRMRRSTSSVAPMSGTRKSTTQRHWAGTVLVTVPPAIVPTLTVMPRS
ncbi:Uncharacterised protein [Bordetella pertussis]|nr:Uncharacterised protein [Bordetella pertussis]